MQKCSFCNFENLVGGRKCARCGKEFARIADNRPDEDDNISFPDTSSPPIHDTPSTDTFSGGGGDFGGGGSGGDY